MDINTPLEEAEGNYCHEIEHWELVFKGFDWQIVLVGKYPFMEEWLNLCNCLNSTFSDLIIDRKLESLGFNQEHWKCMEYNLINEYLNSVAINNHLNPPWSLNLAIRVCFLHYSLEKQQTKEIEMLLNERFPKVYYIATRIIEESQKIGFNTPEKYRLLLKDLISRLGIGSKVLLQRVQISS